MDAPNASAADSAALVVNIAAYLFAPLDRLPQRRAELRGLCAAEGLKGSILLSPEGINLFMAGPRAGIDRLLTHLRGDPLLSALKAKESFSDRQPFSRLLVKLKREIIAFGVEGIAPGRATSRKLPPEQLKRWLDEGRAFTLLDTRNDYEISLGSFEKALPIGVDQFRDFPAAVRRLPESLKDQPIVMFCTGGIRCEKAGPFMEREGFRQVYQLEDGILGYFEKCGAAHFQGDCFVFDQRVALNPRLEETATTQCFACQHPLTLEDQQSEDYIEAVCCPYCRTEPIEAAALTLTEREAAIAAVCTPLPGSRPAVSERPLNVPARHDRRTLVDFLCDYHPHVSRAEWGEIIQAGLLRDRQGPLSGDRIVRGGERLHRLFPDTVEPDVNAAIRIVAWEQDYVVFDKPAPLPLHPCGRFDRNSLSAILALAFPGEYLAPVHRLDANTTGLVVFARNRPAARAIQEQFERRAASKTYLCRVAGHPPWDTVTSRRPIARAPSDGGFRLIDSEAGLPAETAFRVVMQAGNGDAVVEAVPRTGRTNQIRVHLWDLGHPIVGDPVYRPDGELGKQQTLTVTDPPMCLHAWRLAFTPPHGGPPIVYEADRPAWAT